MRIEWGNIGQGAHKWLTHCEQCIVLCLCLYRPIFVYLFGRNLFAFSACQDFLVHNIIEPLFFLYLTLLLFLSLVFRNLIMTCLSVDFFEFFFCLGFPQLLEFIDLSFTRFGKFSVTISPNMFSAPLSFLLVELT